VERRKEPRIAINQEVTVTVLGATDSAPFQATALEVSGSGMRILSPRALKYQAAVKIQARELLLLGEVIRIDSSDRGSMLALKLSHSLDSLADLHRLNQALRWEEHVHEPVACSPVKSVS
jgi:c-di-GMP-binding flagellar brake protein YcgR